MSFSRSIAAYGNHENQFHKNKNTFGYTYALIRPVGDDDEYQQQSRNSLAALQRWPYVSSQTTTVDDDPSVYNTGHFVTSPTQRRTSVLIAKSLSELVVIFINKSSV